MRVLLLLLQAEFHVYQSLEAILDRVADSDASVAVPDRIILRAAAAVVDDAVSKPLLPDEGITLSGEALRARISALATFLGLDEESRVVLPGVCSQ